MAQEKVRVFVDSRMGAETIAGCISTKLILVENQGRDRGRVKQDAALAKVLDWHY